MPDGRILALVMVMVVSVACSSGPVADLQLVRFTATDTLCCYGGNHKLYVLGKVLRPISYRLESRTVSWPYYPPKSFDINVTINGHDWIMVDTVVTNAWYRDGRLDIARPLNTPSGVFYRALRFIFYRDNDRYIDVAESTVAGYYETANDTTCKDEQYQILAPVGYKDGVCADVVTCTANEYQSQPPTPTSNRVCKTLLGCNQQQYQTKAPTATSNRQCTDLTVCEPGHFDNKSSTIEDGQWISDRQCAAWTVCPEGTYVSVEPSASVDRNCTLCNKGYTDHDFNSSTPCRFCEPGHELVVPGLSGPCAMFACPLSTFDDDQSAETACILATTCAAGSAVTAEMTTTTDRVCTLCPAGSVDHDSNPATPCQSCPPGHDLSSPGLMGSCANHMCPLGWTDHDRNVTTPCVLCPAGSHCLAGHADPIEDSLCLSGTSDHDADPGSACVQCLPGSYTPSNHSGDCLSCLSPAVDDDADPSTPCVNCGPGHLVLHSGMAQPCHELMCPSGSADHDQDASTPCQECHIGISFQPSAGQLHCLAVSVDCASGFWEKHPPTSEADRVCTNVVQYCAEFATEDGLVCTACESGLYLTANGTACAPCPAGFYCPNGTNYLPCTAGFIADGRAAACSACQAGTSTMGAEAQFACLPCLTGLFASEAEATPNCSVMTVGFYGVKTPSGGYGGPEQPCPLGHSCEGGSKDACPSGYFQDETQQVSCKPCGLGRFSNEIERITPCHPIDWGYQGSGETNITRINQKPCERGYRCWDGAAFHCPPGTVQPNIGQVVCNTCPQPTFAAQAAMLFCDDCRMSCPSGLTAEGTCNSVSGVPACSDVTAPSLTLFGSVLVEHEAGAPWVDFFGATAEDSRDGPLALDAINVTGMPSGQILGNFSVLYRVADAAGNVAKAVRLVWVRDTKAPVITLLGPLKVELVQGEVFREGGVTAWDTFEGDLTANVQTTGGDVDTTDPSHHVVVYSVVDSSGNAAAPLQRQVVVLSATTEAFAFAAAQAAYLEFMTRPGTTKAADAASAAIEAYRNAGGGRTLLSVVVASAEAAYADRGLDDRSSNLPLLAGTLVGGFLLLLLLGLLVRRRRAQASEQRHMLALQDLKQDGVSPMFQHLGPASFCSDTANNPQWLPSVRNKNTYDTMPESTEDYDSVTMQHNNRVPGLSGRLVSEAAGPSYEAIPDGHDGITLRGTKMVSGEPLMLNPVYGHPIGEQESLFSCSDSEGYMVPGVIQLREAGYLVPQPVGLDGGASGPTYDLPINSDHLKTPATAPEYAYIVPGTIQANTYDCFETAHAQSTIPTNGPNIYAPAPGELSATATKDASKASAGKDGCLETDLLSSEEQWLRPALSRSEAEALLTPKLAGSFVLRRSATQIGCMTISIRLPKHAIHPVYHGLVYEAADGWFGDSMHA